MEVPCIKTPLPGPKAKRLIRQDEKVTSPSYTRVYPLVVERGEGIAVEDVDGNRFLDFTAGIAVTSTGHCHPDVVHAIQSQASRLLHMSGTDFYYRPQISLAEKMTKITPGKTKKRVFFTNSGAESVEAAFKLARYRTNRTRMIAFVGAFHGRTMGALSLTASKSVQVRHFAPLVPEVTHVPFGYCYRCPYNLTFPSCDIECVRYIEETLFKKFVPPEEVAAIIVEPIQGEGGYIVPPPGYHEKLKAICEKYGILYIADEVQTGMGRTGRMFAIQHWGVIPDIICIAKGVASGMPLGILVADADIMTWEEGAHASTFGGNPVSCAAALETIRLIEEKLMANAAKVGLYLLRQLEQLQEEFELIGDVRGRGLMVGIELVKDRTTKELASKERNQIIQECFKKGLLLLGCGESGIRFCPPLIITQQEVDIAIEILHEVFQKITKNNGRHSRTKRKPSR